MAAQMVGSPEDCNWSYSGSNTSGSIPSIMIFRPTWDEFKDFNKYLEYVESQGAQKAGICKIIPPKEWEPRKKKFNIDDLENVKIPDPIEQAVNGNQGIYQCFNVKKRSMTAKEYYKKANSPKYKAPGQVTDLEDLERKYWKNITFVPPIYGADVPGSVTDNDCNVWNIQKLGSVLDWINEDYNVKISGVNTAYLYFGMWKSTFAWHTEDMDLHSINYLHYGESKFWYSIPPAYARRFESIAERLFPFLHKECPSYLRHKMCLISPNVLRNNSIPYNKIAQKEGEIMITFPLGYHSGFNTGFNVAESTNFATKRWVEYGKRATRCYCRSEAVHISMDCFVRRLQPERYEDWLAGQDMGRHPEEPDARPTPAPAPNVEEFLMNIHNKDVEIPLCLLEPTKKKRRHPIHKKNNSESKETAAAASLQEPQVKINRLTDEECRKYNNEKQKRMEAFTTDEDDVVKPPSADLWSSFETITGEQPDKLTQDSDKTSKKVSKSKQSYVIPRIRKVKGSTEQAKSNSPTKKARPKSKKTTETDSKQTVEESALAPHPQPSPPPSQQPPPQSPPAKMSETAKNTWVAAFTKEPPVVATTPPAKQGTPSPLQKLKNSLATSSPRPPERAYIRPPQFQYSSPRMAVTQPSVRPPPPPAHASSSVPRAWTFSTAAAAPPPPTAHHQPHPAYIQSGRQQLTVGQPHGLSLNEYFSTLNPISPASFATTTPLTHFTQNNHETWSMTKPNPPPPPVFVQQQQQQPLTLVNFMGLRPSLPQIDPGRQRRLGFNRLLLASDQKRPIKTSISVVTPAPGLAGPVPGQWQLEGYVSMADGAIYIYLTRQDGSVSTKSFFLPFRDILGKRRTDAKEAWPPTDDQLAATEDITAWELHMVINSKIIEMNIVDPWKKTYLVKIPGEALA